MNSVENNLSETTHSYIGLLLDSNNYTSVRSSSDSGNNDASDILFDQPKRAKPNENAFAINNCNEELKLGAVKFCLTLHNNNNFSKSDVHNIQNYIQINIINPIVNLLKDVIQKEIEEPLLISKFSQVLFGRYIRYF